MKPLQHKKHTLAKRGFSLLCVLALCLGLLPVTALAAAPSGQVIYVGNVNVTSGGKLDGTPTGNGTVIDKSSPVSYLDENGTDQSCNDYEVVTADDTQWTTGWYVVNSDVTINQRIPVNGDVKLILTDGHTLTVNGGIHVTGDDRFTVYGQENGTGKLTATATNNVGAGIGGNGITTTSAQNGENGGTIIIAGGIIEAVGGDFANDTDSPCGGAGIGNGNGASNGGSVTVYGGEVNATGGVANAGIGGDGSTIQILGGTVEATSGGAGAAAIGGTNGAAGTIIITESNVTANGIDGTGIGSGWEDHGGTITITNSTVTAIGGGGAGIGGGSGSIGSAGGNGGNVTIVNSTVTASSKEGDSIGAGRNGAAPGTLILSPADGKAIAAKAGADEASALTLNGSPFTAKTAVTDLVRGTKYFHSEPCSIYTVTVNDSYAQTTGAGNYAEGATVAIDAGTRSGYTFDGWTSEDGVTFADASKAQTSFTMPGKVVTVTANWRKNASPSTPPIVTPPTVSEETTDAIQAADPGETVTVDLSSGSTKLDKEVFETLAGKDVILVVDLGDGVSWTVNGSDIPEDADFTDIDMGVTMNSDGIPVDIINAITGERGSIQLELAHNGAFGFTMTLAAPLGAENAGYWANLYHFNEDAGTMTFETAAQISDDGSVSLSLSHASQYAIVIDDHNHGIVTLPFTDVSECDWFYDPVCYVYSQGLMTGTSATTFEPNTSLSRAMLVAVLHRLEGSPAASAGDFSDVAEGDWYAQAVNWAASVGVVNGFDDGTFQPNAAITREQMAAILRNYAAYKGLDVSASGSLSTFTDAASVSDWAQESVEWMVGSGLLGGYEDNTLRPQGTTTRAEVASVLQRALGNVAGNQ